MEFCAICAGFMEKKYEPPAKVVFVCPRCQGKPRDGSSLDTLAYDHSAIADEQSHRVLIQRMPFDLASKNVPFDCAKCGRRYVSLVRIGASATTLYVCECGAHYTSADVDANVRAAASKK